nr:hypothetical protein K-LCC10_0303 [Kaumoebavirus]
MDSTTFILLSAFFPPEILALIETHLIEAYRLERPKIVLGIVCHDGAIIRRIENGKTRFSYFACPDCGSLISERFVKGHYQHVLNCEHTREHYKKEYWEPRTSIVDGVIKSCTIWAKN